MNRLYYGDNLDVLRNMGENKIENESVDLIYLDPPFNSKRDYNLLFKSPAGHKSDAQITAFEDSWHWGEQAEREFHEIVHQSNTQVAQMMIALREFLGVNDMMAYLTMMCNRLLELHRVLKPTGSLYLHCDPTASHYLKIVLDGVFGKDNFRNEITWKRTSGHNSAKRWGPIHDVIFFYSKSQDYEWNKLFMPYDKGYVKSFYKFSDENGVYRQSDLTGAGIRRGDSGKPWKGGNPTEVGRHWAIPLDILKEILAGKRVKNLSTQDKLDLLEEAGLISWPKNGKIPRLKRYLQSDKGKAIQDVITDILPVQTHAFERLGYPTQKPLALLERIIQASSDEGGVVLDPFCGCGTAVHAAHKLNRQWIGIDITHLAITLIEKRLRDAFPGIEYEVYGAPKDFEGAKNLAVRDKYQFQWWACSLVNAQPYQGKKKGADSGVDGLIFFEDAKVGMTKKIIVSIKGGENINVGMVRDLKGVIEREKAEIGLFVTLYPPTMPMRNEAAAAGFYESENFSRLYPKIQILTIDGLLEGREKPLFPDLTQGSLMFKKAKQEEKKKSGSDMFSK